MGKVMLEDYKCELCGHTWIPRSKIDENPTICPKCKSPYWDKPRKVNTTDLARESMMQKRKRMEI